MKLSSIVFLSIMLSLIINLIINKLFFSITKKNWFYCIISLAIIIPINFFLIKLLLPLFNASCIGAECIGVTFGAFIIILLSALLTGVVSVILVHNFRIICSIKRRKKR